MPRLQYIKKRFHKASLATIAYANDLLEQYQDEGFIVSLRQLYYRMLSLGYITENNLKSYKRLGKLMSDARLAGLTDWSFMEDRGRMVQMRSHWSSPNAVIRSAANSYSKDLWEGQTSMLECWFEKDALMGVFEPTCDKWDVPFFSCRGYSSQSEMWRAGQRLLSYIERGMEPVILYLGDHDPSGIQMTEDISNRMSMFCGEPIEVKRLALTMDQVHEYNPPPNFAKETDSRFDAYVRCFATEECWELDALEPSTLSRLVETAILKHLDRDKFDRKVALQEGDRRVLKLIAKYYNVAADAVVGLPEEE